MKEKTLENATKAPDWECTSKANIGYDSYRVYESKSTGEKVVQDGKNDKRDLETLKCK